MPDKGERGNGGRKDEGNICRQNVTFIDFGSKFDHSHLFSFCSPVLFLGDLRQCVCAHVLFLHPPVHTEGSLITTIRRASLPKKLKNPDLPKKIKKSFSSPSFLGIFISNPAFSDPFIF